MKKYDEDELKIKNICNQAQKDASSFWTNFLDPLQQKKIASALKKQGVESSFFGGYDQAERKRLYVKASWDLDSDPTSEGLPIGVLLMDVGSDTTHRDVLGALLATGIKRDQLGDLLLSDGTCTLFLVETMSQYIKNHLESIRNHPPNVRIGSLADVSVPKTRYRAEPLVLSSLRLDNLVAKACRLPRTEGALLVEKGYVKVDHEPITKGAATVEPGQMVSVRGYGRFLVQVGEGKTKKGNFKGEIHWIE